MVNLNVDIEYIELQEIYGIWQKSNDKTVSKDIKTLSKKYITTVPMTGKMVLPYFVLSKNYDALNHNFEMFIGGNISNSNLESLILPAGEYAKITVKPKLGFLWGASIGEAKRYFYTKWLPKSNYEALNMEYEYHTEKSTGNNPTIDLIFAIQKK